MSWLTQRGAGRSDNIEAGEAPYFEVSMTCRIGSMFEHWPRRHAFIPQTAAANASRLMDSPADTSAARQQTGSVHLAGAPASRTHALLPGSTPRRQSVLPPSEHSPPAAPLPLAHGCRYPLAAPAEEPSRFVCISAANLPHTLPYPSPDHPAGS